MLISVVMPSFNQARFLDAAIRSVVEQEYQNWQLIIRDGGSQDGSVDIIRQQASKYPDKILWRSHPDEGQSAAINEGLDISRGEILCFLNSDDRLAPASLKTVHDYFSDHKNAQLLYGEADFVDEWDNFLKSYPVEPWNYRRLRETCFICQPACFWRRHIYQRFGGFDPKLTCAFDYEYWLRIGRETPFIHLKERLAFSRCHVGAKSSALKGRAVEEAFQTARRYFPGELSPIWARKLSVARGSQTLSEEDGSRGSMDFCLEYWHTMIDCLPEIDPTEYFRWLRLLSPPYQSARRRLEDPLVELKP